MSGFLAGSAVVGSIIYPPIMGFLSVTVGLTIAMLGTVVLAFACAGALVLVSVSRSPNRASRLRRLGPMRLRPRSWRRQERRRHRDPRGGRRRARKGKRPPVRVTINGYTYRNTSR